jgi:hypothetical protein
MLRLDQYRALAAQRYPRDAWIKLSDPDSRERLVKYGIDWRLSVPPGAGELEVNVKRLRRQIRFATLGELMIRGGILRKIVQLSQK